MDGIFFEITIVITFAAVLTILFRILKQPAILAYILAGVILGPLGVFHLSKGDELQTLGQLGITLSLFMLGLELKLNELRSIGKTAVILGTLQMVSTFAAGFGLAQLLGFSSSIAVYIALAVSFSSTIVIVKLLSDKKDLTSLHGKLSIGLLLIQDFFAVLTIIFLTGFSDASGTSLPLQVVVVLLKVIVLVGWIMVLSNYLFPKIVHKIAHSEEALFLFCLAWVFALTALVSSKTVGFSLEIGGFLAGLALANSHEHFQIVAKMRSLRDFFITLFFVTLGLEMHIHDLSVVIFPALVLSLFVLLLKPVFITIITQLLGFRKRTALFVGFSMGQISEFSLIILFLGSTLGVVPESVVTIMVLVAVITFAGSTYMIKGENILYKKIHPLFRLFERQKTNVESSFSRADTLEELDDHVVVIGADQLGKSIIRALEHSDERLVIVDFDPDIVKKLSGIGYPILFGDVADPEIQERVKMDKAKLVISTVPDIEDNLLLIQGLDHVNKKARVIVMAYTADDARDLYKAGADYVILPHLAGGRHLAKILLDKNHLKLIEDYKARDLSDLS